DEMNINPDNPTVKIAWDAADGAKQYNIYRKTSGSMQPEKIGDSTEPAFIDENAEVGLIYEYTVTTVDPAGKESVPSLPIEVEMIDSSIPVPNVPENIQEVSVNKNEITISWDSVDGATVYNVYRATKEDGEYT